MMLNVLKKMARRKLGNQIKKILCIIISAKLNELIHYEY